MFTESSNADPAIKSPIGMRLLSLSPLSRHGFIGLCIVGSAILSALIGQSWLSLALYGASVILVVFVALILRDLHRNPAHRRWLVPAAILTLVGLFTFTRFGRLQIALFGSPVLRGGEWVGLSYLLFRLIHVLIDSKRLPDLSITDLTAYALFPPALVAGPIHRADKFLPQIDQPHYPVSNHTAVDCLWRISLGAFKKLVLANALALFALSSAVGNNRDLPRGLLLIAVLAYGFMLYFDFAGYSDIAIGVAGLFGVTLPENFANPYVQPNITRFWQAWHITLSSWLRDYIFFPLSRTLLGRFGRRFSAPIMAVAHLVTMIIAGLWHGFGTGFIAWGAWHGIGLFAHAQWSNIARQRNIQIPTVIGIGLTFVFVMIGWVFFALPDFSSALSVLRRIFLP